MVRVQLDRRAEIGQRLGQVALLAPELAARVEDIGQRRIEPQHRVVIVDGAVGLSLRSKAAPRAISALMRSAFAVFSLSISSPQALMILSSSSAAAAAMQAVGSTCTSLAGSAPVAKAPCDEATVHSSEAAIDGIADRSQRRRIASIAFSVTRLHRDAAIDHQLEPGDVFQFIGGQKQRRVGDVPGVAHVAHRHLRVARAPHRLDVARGIARRQARRNARPSASSSGPAGWR